MRWPAIAGVLALSALVRLVMLGSFPLVEADEGLWTNSTKNFLRFGDWFMDGRTHLFLSPVFHAFTLPVFAIGGASIAGARLVSACAGVVSVWLLYRVVLHETRKRDHALLAAVVLGLSHWAILTSRKAMIEPLELCMILLATDLIVRDGWRQLAGGGVLAIALLTKLNAVFMLPVVALYLLWPHAASARANSFAVLRHGALVAARPLVIAVLGAAAVYGALYASHPMQFASAFRFELDGVHFEAISHPIIRTGRFGIDPLQEARTIIEIFRDSPFVMVLAVLGVIAAAVERTRGSRLFALWLIVGLPFFLGQMLQPVRYFYLVLPALAFFAAGALVRLGSAGTAAVAGRNLPNAMTSAAAVAFVLFELAYAGASAASNHERALPTVKAWAARTTNPSDPVMAAGYYCTDLPNRAYAHYRLARDSTQLFESIQRFGIRYVIVDNVEWRQDLRDAVARRYERVAEWPFGAAYRVSPPSQ